MQGSLPPTPITPAPLGTFCLGSPLTFWLSPPGSLAGPSCSHPLNGPRPSHLCPLPQPLPSLIFSATSSPCTPFLSAGLLSTQS